MNRSEDEELSVLAGRGATASVAPPRKSVIRTLTPWFTILGLALLLAYVLRDRLLPAPAVRITTVVAKPQSASSSTAATVTVQAPGWIEPDPYPVYVSALTPGIVENVLVLEGQRVKAGEIVATLISEDASLEVEKAEADVTREQVARTAAKSHWDHPIELDRAIDIAKNQCEEIRAKLAELAAIVAQKAAKTAEAEDLNTRMTKTKKGTSAELAIQRAHFQLLAQKAEQRATEQRKAVLLAQLAGAKISLAAAQEDRERRIEDQRRLADAESNLAAAKVRLKEAQLRLSRMAVRSPADGIVIDLLTAPGAKLMLDMDNPHSAHVAHLYDPEHLQARVDIPLADAALVGVGQKATIVVDILPDENFEGKVTRFVQQADLSKNTVQAKVAIENPSELLRPQMLTRVRFLAQETKGSANTASGNGLGIWVHQDSVQKVNKDMGVVWLVTADGAQVLRREVELQETRDDWIAVTSGLNPGDRLVLHPPPDLQDSQRIRVIDNSAGGL